MSTPSKSVLLLGATGLVGGECLKRLAADPAFGNVVALTRRPLAAPLSPKVENRLVDFHEPSTFEPYLKVDAVVCALGTTIKKAGSQAAFRNVDYAYPLAFARAARASGASHFLLVTSMGADPHSRTFYLRVKGEVEDAISSLAYPSLSIFRPSLLLGPREEFRFGEFIGQKLLGAARAAFPRPVRPVTAACIAEAMVHSLCFPPAGREIVTNAGILSLCEANRRQGP